MKIQRMKCQNWKLLHLEYISSMVKFYIIILLIIQPKFILAQDEVLQGEDDYIYDFDTVVPIFSVNDDMLEIALDSMCSYFGDKESIPKQWDLVLSYIDSEKINFYFSVPFFLSIHKVGYGVLMYKDFLFVIRGIKYSGLVETMDKVNVCMCPSYPCFTWDPPSALFVRENDTLYKVYITK